MAEGNFLLWLQDRDETEQEGATHNLEKEERLEEKDGQSSEASEVEEEEEDEGEEEDVGRDGPRLSISECSNYICRNIKYLLFV